MMLYTARCVLGEREGQRPALSFQCKRIIRACGKAVAVVTKNKVASTANALAVQNDY